MKVSIVPWLLFLVLWSATTLTLTEHWRAADRAYLDAATYYSALDDLRNQRSPYCAPAQCQSYWRAVHEAESRAGQSTDRPSEQGPFLYPPTILQILDIVAIPPYGFVFALGMSTLGFCWIWLRATAATPWWLLLPVLSWDVHASLGAGNVELLLLFLTLAGSWLLWQHYGLAASAAVALVILVKPYYGLAFASFGVLTLVVRPDDRPAYLRTFTSAALAVAALVLLSCSLWPAWLRPLAVEFLTNGVAYTWYALPIGVQTPMSAQNRSFMQGLVIAGVSSSYALSGSLLAWGAILAVSVRQVAAREVGFALVFALSFVLLYSFRPVGWFLTYIDFVVLAAVWPYMTKKEKRVLIAGAIALAGSHWMALALTLSGWWGRLATMQSAAFPWETWGVFPAAWILLLVAARRHALLRPQAI